MQIDRNLHQKSFYRGPSQVKKRAATTIISASIPNDVFEVYFEIALMRQNNLLCQ